MAITLKLRRDTTDLSLQGGATGIQLLEGWEPRIGAVPGPDGIAPLVTETLPLLVGSTSHNGLATLLQSLHEMQQWVQDYFTFEHETRAVWLHAKLDGETGERRALVYRVEATFKTGWFDAESVCYLQEVELVLDRGPWETTTAVAGGGITNDVAAVHVFDYTATPGVDVVGDIPARLEQVRLDTRTDTVVSGDYDRIWMGVRSAARHGTLASFVPLWEVELGSEDTANGAAETADAAASNSSKVQVSGASPAGWLRRTVIPLSKITANYERNYGRYLALLRARVQIGSVWDVQFRYTFWNSAAALVGPVVTVAEYGSDWEIYEMGQHTIPARQLHALPAGIIPATVDRYHSLEIWARRTTGSGYLDLDCIIQLPIDEGYCIAKDVDLDFTFATLGQYGKLYVGCAPEDVIHANGLVPVGTTADNVTTVPRLSAYSFFMPPGDGRIYAVVAGLNKFPITNTVGAMYAAWYPRWLSLRGSE